jgi:hypothetical protein
MANTLVAVQTYQASALGRLLNMFCGIHTFNKRFQDFEKLIANLGSTVTFDLPPRMVTSSGLVVSSFNPLVQRVQSLTVGATDAVGNTQQANANWAATAQDLIFNIDNNDYRTKVEESAMVAMGTLIESSVMATPVNQAYRYFDVGVTSDVVNQITSFNQLGQMLAKFRNFGTVNTATRAYIDDYYTVPNVIGSGFNQFVLNRNEETFASWEIGKFSQCDWYRSNLLPQHVSGSTGNLQQTLTVVSIDSTGTILTLSGASASDANAVQANDLFRFQDGVVGQPNMRYLTFTGYQPSQSPVEVRAVAQAGSTSGGQVTVTIFPALISTAGNVNQNIPASTPVTAGMQLLGVPNHRRGFVNCGDSAFLAMPQLPDQEPFPTSSKVDMESGASIRGTYGVLYGQNTYGFTFDAIWGSTIVPEYTMAIILPF